MNRFASKSENTKLRNTKFLSLFHLIYIRLEINERFYIPWNLPLTILRGFKFRVLLGIYSYCIFICLPEPQNHSKLFSHLHISRTVFCLVDYLNFICNYFIFWACEQVIEKNLQNCMHFSRNTTNNKHGLSLDKATVLYYV